MRNKKVKLKVKHMPSEQMIQMLNETDAEMNSCIESLGDVDSRDAIIVNAVKMAFISGYNCGVTDCIDAIPLQGDDDIIDYLVSHLHKLHKNPSIYCH